MNCRKVKNLSVLWLESIFKLLSLIFVVVTVKIPTTRDWKITPMIWYMLLCANKFPVRARVRDFGGSVYSVILLVFIQSPSYEELRSQLPPGCPTSITGRFSPSPQERGTSSSSPSPTRQRTGEEEGRPMELDGLPSSPRDLIRRPSSPVERSRKYSDVQNPGTALRSFSPDRMANIRYSFMWF